MRQLLRGLLGRCRTPCSYQSHESRPYVAFTHGAYQSDPLLPATEQFLSFPSSKNGEKCGPSPQDMPSCFSGPVGFSEKTDFLKPSWTPHLKAFSWDPCQSISSLRVESPVLSLLSQIRGGGTSQNLGCNGHVRQLGRYCSSVSGHQLEGELGDTPGFTESVDGLSATTTNVAAKLATPEVQAVSEVGAIIGDCSYPTAFLQLFIDSLHVNLGLPWWGALVVATITIRLLCIPIIIYQLKSTAKLTLMRPEMEKLSKRLKENANDPIIAAQGSQEMFALFKKYDTKPWSPFVGAFLTAPIFICFFFAIQNMCQRLESFKTGGVLLFTDLTAVDSTYILPLILSSTMLLTVELHAVDGMEGSPYADKMKQFMRIFSVVLFPISLNFETALFFYWIPSNMFAMFQSLILKQKFIKQFVGIPLTEHLAQATAKDVIEVKAPALPDTSSNKGSVRKKLGLVRKNSRGSRRR